MHPATDSDGYQVVTLYLNGTRPSRKVHTLVLEAFVGPRPDGMVTRHLDGDPSNNRLSNIAYGTPRENSLDRVRHGRGSKPGKFCRRGHPMVPDKSGWCSTCRTERYHARRKAQKALASSSAS
jgi:hypothetical protein